MQEFSGFLKVLNPALQAGDHVLLVLYHRGTDGASYQDIENWSRASMRTNLRRTLSQLSEDRAYIHFDGAKYYITRTGMREVERRKLYQLPD